MKHFFATIFAAVLWLAYQSPAYSQGPNADSTLRQLSRDLADPQKRASIALSVFALDSMNSSFANGPADPPQLRLSRLIIFSQFIVSINPGDFGAAINPNSIQDADRALTIFDRFAQRTDLIANTVLFLELRQAVAALAVITKMSQSPVRQESLCNSFFFQWFCRQFG